MLSSPAELALSVLRWLAVIMGEMSSLSGYKEGSRGLIFAAAVKQKANSTVKISSSFAKRSRRNIQQRPEIPLTLPARCVRMYVQLYFNHLTFSILKNASVVVCRTSVEPNFPLIVMVL